MSSCRGEIFHLVEHSVDRECGGELLLELLAPVDQLFEGNAISLAADAVHDCVETVEPLCSHLCRVYLTGHTPSYAILERPLEVVRELIAIQPTIFVDV